MLSAVHSAARRVAASHTARNKISQSTTTTIANRGIKSSLKHHTSRFTTTTTSTSSYGVVGVKLAGGATGALAAATTVTQDTETQDGETDDTVAKRVEAIRATNYSPQASAVILPQHKSKTLKQLEERILGNHGYAVGPGREIYKPATPEEQAKIDRERALGITDQFFPSEFINTDDPIAWYRTIAEVPVEERQKYIDNVDNIAENAPIPPQGELTNDEGRVHVVDRKYAESVWSNFRWIDTYASVYHLVTGPPHGPELWYKKHLPVIFKYVGLKHENTDVEFVYEQDPDAPVDEQFGTLLLLKQACEKERFKVFRKYHTMTHMSHHLLHFLLTFYRQLLRANPLEGKKVYVSEQMETIHSGIQESILSISDVGAAHRQLFDVVWDNFDAQQNDILLENLKDLSTANFTEARQMLLSQLSLAQKFNTRMDGLIDRLMNHTQDVMAFYNPQRQNLFFQIAEMEADPVRRTDIYSLCGLFKIKQICNFDAIAQNLENIEYDNAQPLTDLVHHMPTFWFNPAFYCSEVISDMIESVTWAKSEKMSGKLTETFPSFGYDSNEKYQKFDQLIGLDAQPKDAAQDLARILTDIRWDARLNADIKGHVLKRQAEYRQDLVADAFAQQQELLIKAYGLPEELLDNIEAGRDDELDYDRSTKRAFKNVDGDARGVPRRYRSASEPDAEYDDDYDDGDYYDDEDDYYDDEDDEYWDDEDYEDEDEEVPSNYVPLPGANTKTVATKPYQPKVSGDNKE